MPLTQIQIVRLNIGDTTAPYKLTDEEVQHNLDLYPVPPYEVEQQTYFATLACLEWLIAKSTSKSSVARQKVGEVETEYSSTSGSSYKDLLDYWLKNPPTSLQSSPVGTFKFGNTDGAKLKLGMFDCCNSSNSTNVDKFFIRDC